MKREYKCMPLFVAVLFSVSVKAQSGLDECIELAYRNYPQIEEYDLVEASRGYDISNAARAWLPQMTVSGKASVQSAVVEMPFEIPGMEFSIPHDQYGVTADITQQIWDGGASAVKRKMADAGADVRKRQLDVSLYSIRSRVQNIYLGIKLLDRQLELNDILCGSLSRTLKETEAMFENGVAFESDRDQVMVNILACEQQRLSLEKDRGAYVRMLSLLTGTDMEGVDLPEPDAGVRSDTQEFARPEQTLYEAQLRQNLLQKEQLKAGLSPRLNIFMQAGYGRPGLNMLSGEFDPYMTAGLRLQWNLGGLYTLRNDMRRIDADARKIELTQKSFLMNTSIEAVQKESEVEKAEDVLLRDEEIIRLRENILDSAEQQYKQGVIKMNDYLTLLDEAFRARLNYNVHTIQYIMSVYDLQNTTGNR